MPKLPKTVRAEVSQERFDAFEDYRRQNGLNKQQGLASLIDLIPLAYLLQVDSTPPTVELQPEPPATVVVQLEPDSRIHVTTRQAQPKRFKEKLLPKAPECRLDIDESINKRDILYHSSHEAEVQVYLAECPTGGKKERETHKSIRGKYHTKRERALEACEAILAGHSGPMSIDELYPLVRATGWKPAKKDFSGKATLRKFLQKEPLFDFSLKMDTVSLVKVEPPKVEEKELPTTDDLRALLEVASEEPPTVEEDSPKKRESVPSFFPRPGLWDR